MSRAKLLASSFRRYLNCKGDTTGCFKALKSAPTLPDVSQKAMPETDYCILEAHCLGRYRLSSYCPLVGLFVLRRNTNQVVVKAPIFLLAHGLFILALLWEQQSTSSLRASQRVWWWLRRFSEPAPGRVITWLTMPVLVGQAILYRAGLEGSTGRSSAW